MTATREESPKTETGIKRDNVADISAEDSLIEFLAEEYGCEKTKESVMRAHRAEKARKELSAKLREDTQAIGFAVYLDNLNLYYRKEREFDSDILILFDSDCSSVSLLSTVESFVSKGFSVRVEHNAPEGYKAKTVYSFENGALREVK